MSVGGRAAMPDAHGRGARTVVFRENASTALAAAARRSSGAREAAHGGGARAAQMEGGEAVAVGGVTAAVEVITCLLSCW